MLSRNNFLTAALTAGLFAAAPCAAQLTPPVPSDPLARIRAAAAANSQACTVEATSPCAQANPKIIAAAQSSTTVDVNLRELLSGQAGSRQSGTAGLTKAVTWAVAAFKAAGVDDVRAEKFTVPAEWPSNTRPPVPGETVIAEIRGREKPDEFVVLSSHLDSIDSMNNPDANDTAYDAALVIETARLIHLTGLRPRRSIRFILFTDRNDAGLDSRAYVQAHRSELDHISAAVEFDFCSHRVDGFDLGGRPEFEAGVHEVLKDFESSWGITHYPTVPPFNSGSLDFLLQGVPVLLAGPFGDERLALQADNVIELENLKHNTAVAGVLIFGLAEREMPLGARLSRPQIDALLERTGVASAMRRPGFLQQLWQEWQIWRLRQP